MKLKIFITIVLSICCTFTVNAQQLSLYELHKLCNASNWQEGADILTAKGWKLFTFDSRKIRYAYNVYENGYADGWLEFTINYSEKIDHIVYSSKEENVSAIKASLSAYGYKQFKSRISDEQIKTYYTNDKMTIQFSIVKFRRDTGEMDNSFYVFLTPITVEGFFVDY